VSVHYSEKNSEAFEQKIAGSDFENLLFWIRTYGLMQIRPNFRIYLGPRSTIHNEVFQHLFCRARYSQIIKPGVTTDEIDQLVTRLSFLAGAYPSPLNYRWAYRRKAAFSHSFKLLSKKELENEEHFFDLISKINIIALLRKFPKSVCTSVNNCVRLLENI